MTTPEPTPQHAAVPAVADTTPWLSGKAYDYLKFLAQILLPAAGTLYFGLSGIWGFPDTEQVVGTITVVDTFLGVLLTVTKAQFLGTSAAYDGTATVLNSGGSLNLNVDPSVFVDQKTVTLKVVPPAS